MGQVSGITWAEVEALVTCKDEKQLGAVRSVQTAICHRRLDTLVNFSSHFHPIGMSSTAQVEERPSLTLKFFGEGAEVRLEEVVFRNQSGVQRSRAGKTSRASEGSFQWSVALKSMCLLFVRSVRSFAEGAKGDTELIGGEGSPASSLDLAIAKGGGLVWMTEMFGTTATGDTLAKRMFTRANTNRRKKFLRVRVSVNTHFLPIDRIKIYRDNELLESVPSLAKLDDDIAAGLVRTAIEDVQSRAIVGADNRSPVAPTFHDKYREIWASGADLETKISESRQLLGSATPNPYIQMLYRVQITSNDVGDAEFEIFVVACNCGFKPIERQRHEFRFDSIQPTPFVVDVAEPNSMTMLLDDSIQKVFFIEFETPIQPGETRSYHFRYRGFRVFEERSLYWDFPLGTRIMNHILFNLIHEHSNPVTGASVEQISHSASGPAVAPAPVVVEWGNGIAINWHMPFPEPGNIYRVRWNLEPPKRKDSDS